MIGEDGIRPLARSQLVQHLPIIVYVLEQLGIVDVLRRRLPKHDLSHVSDADCVAVLILNILSGRCALYNIEHFLKGVDLPLLIGDHAKPEHFNVPARSGPSASGGVVV